MEEGTVWVCEFQVLGWLIYLFVKPAEDSGVMVSFLFGVGQYLVSKSQLSHSNITPFFTDDSSIFRKTWISISTSCLLYRDSIFCNKFPFGKRFAAFWLIVSQSLKAYQLHPVEICRKATAAMLTLGTKYATICYCDTSLKQWSKVDCANWKVVYFWSDSEEDYCKDDQFVHLEIIYHLFRVHNLWAQLL